LKVKAHGQANFPKKLLLQLLKWLRIPLLVHSWPYKAEHCITVLVARQTAIVADQVKPNHCWA
jgi:hypothetical protein